MTASPKATRRRVWPFSRLAFRLMVTFGIVLMPLALLSFVQIRQYQQEASARAEAAVLGATMQAALPLIDQITRAEGAVAALATAVMPLRDDPVACSALLRRFMAVPGSSDYSFVGYIPRSLRMECSPGGPLDLTDRRDLLAVMDAGISSVRVNPHGPVSRTSVLIFSEPVRDETGRVVGLLSLSLPHRALADRGAGAGLGPGGGPDVSLMTLDRKGQILSASQGLEDAELRLPALPDLVTTLGENPGSFTALSVRGEERIFAVMPMLSTGLYVLGDWPMTDTDARLFERTFPIIAFPALMWLASLLVAQLAAEHQVLRHIRQLRGAITSFAGGNRRAPEVPLRGAPHELKSLGGAFEQLMEAVVHDEAELEDTIHQKEVLLREVHHRVKNNLQLIASIINMQIRKARSPETKGLLKSLQDRVMSLATIHRELYQTTGGSDVRVDELLHNIVNQILKMGSRPGAPFAVETDLEDIHLTPDQAVPLSLLVTEALTNALKYASAPPGERPRLHLSLRRTEDGRAEIVIRNSMADQSAPVNPALDSEAEGAGLGDALVRAFAAQLATSVERSQEGGEYRLAFRFTPTALSDAEERITT